MSTHVKDAIETGFAFTTLAAAWLGLFSTALTIVATALTILWSIIKISETDWWRNRKWWRR